MVMVIEGNKVKPLLNTLLPCLAPPNIIRDLCLHRSASASATQFVLQKYSYSFHTVLLKHFPPMDLLMMMRKGTYILVIALFMLATANSQKLCNHTTQISPKSNASYIENFSTVKCLRVDGFGVLPNSKVVLDECSYWKTPSKDQEFSLTDNPLGKSVLKTTGNNRENFCLTIRNGILQSSTCRPSDFDQSWTLKKLRDNGNQFLIEQYSTKKCLIPKSRETGTTVKLVPCNSFETEQIWKICN